MVFHIYECVSKLNKKLPKKPRGSCFLAQSQAIFFGFIRCVFVCFKVRMMFLKNCILLWTSPKNPRHLDKMIQVSHMNQTSIFVMFFVARWFFILGRDGNMAKFLHFLHLGSMDSTSKSQLWDASSSWTNGFFAWFGLRGSAGNSVVELSSNLSKGSTWSTVEM